MENYRTSGYEMIASFWRNRSLVLALTKREVISRYQGSTLGLAWSFFNPILLLSVYTFFFSVVFQARWEVTANPSQADFALILFAGLIVHSLFAECLQRSPTLIVDRVNYVKKVIFPLEILSMVALGAALFHCLVSVAILVLAFAVINGYVYWTALLFPIVIFPLILGTLGISWLLAGLGVYFRDVGQITGMIVTILLFISPVFYPTSALPSQYQWVANLNPLAFVIESSRNVLIYGKMPNWGHEAILALISAIVAWFGFICFQRFRKGFADVL